MIQGNLHNIQSFFNLFGVQQSSGCPLKVNGFRILCKISRELLLKEKISKISLHGNPYDSKKWKKGK